MGKLDKAVTIAESLAKRAKSLNKAEPLDGLGRALPSVNATQAGAARPLAGLDDLIEYEGAAIQADRAALTTPKEIQEEILRADAELAEQHVS